MAIHKLSPLVANQIAAGEVVERPASVVKELLENAIDAKADRIQIDIERGGTRLIRVTDNGEGISRDELELALARHATSKIEHSDDLKAIYTLGFRGEALASISSVAKLKLSSRPQAQDMGWSAIAEGLDMQVKLQPQSLPAGTIVEVRDLFFNTPARQKFLRAERTEFVHIEETVKRIALGSPHVAITLRHNSKVVKRVPAAHNSEQHQQRIGSILGASFLREAIKLDSTIDATRLYGWLSPVDWHQSSSLGQYVFVNGRAVRDRTLNHAIRQAYHDRLPAGRMPAYVLYLELEASQVDVNVHPTKHEVRFSNGRQVHDFMSHAVEEALLEQGEMLELNQHAVGDNEELVYMRPSHSVAQPTTKDDPYFTPRHKAGAFSQQRADHVADSSPAQYRPQQSCQWPQKPKVSSKLASGNSWVLHDRLLLQQTEEGIKALDLKAYFCQHISDCLHSEWQQGEVKQRLMLFPLRLGIPADNVSDEFINQWQKAGFEMTLTGPKTLVVRKVPSCVLHIDLQQWLQEVVYQAVSKNLSTADWQKQLMKSLQQYWAPDSQTHWLEELAHLPWTKSSFCKRYTAEQLLELLVSPH
ncbi:DNA mismatch repair endonuclease MutL [Kangiella koreensis]|uniref:DNA mismatch repair protein MutL n=1 Tax=Kangiella koreensis (strain DSM 16069 / JCM 12317 / KCTC 12182 / SW-125) TaxID=523791 RepID=C7R8S3_KANKD|nr:DNA mismatch repair endonuclease MutL [Kangiella koreensis]ACV25936.1 DNA mismatch repair protein MutL [Kangiella koreensis DSM 16069]